MQWHRVSAPVRILSAFTVLLSLAAPLRAQTVDDGIMLAKHDLFTGNLYVHDSWTKYWEGALERENGNIGTLTTQTNIWYANYGVTDRLNVIGMVPLVWTRASQGVLRGQKGLQDLTIAAKYNVLEKQRTPIGALRVIGVLSAGLPMTDYTADFYPLSLGSNSRKISGRGTVFLNTARGLYVNGSTSYSWRGNVTLDRPYFYTDDELVFSNEVPMPDVFDYTSSVGYMNNGLMTGLTFAQQWTRGGGDIRRQDMPFVSNRMNFSKIGGMIMAPIPKLRDLKVHVAYAYTLNGRNVGRATTVTTGILYHFNGRGSTP